MYSIYSVAEQIEKNFGYKPLISIANRIDLKAEENSFITGMIPCWRVKFDKTFETHLFDLVHAENEYQILYDKIAATLTPKG